MLVGIFSSSGACSALRSFERLVLTLAWADGDDLRGKLDLITSLSSES
jgi:hypothetical protein